MKEDADSAADYTVLEELIVKDAKDTSKWHHDIPDSDGYLHFGKSGLGPGLIWLKIFIVSERVMNG